MQKMLSTKKVKRLVIKVGSGLLTTDHGLCRPFFSALASEIARLKKSGIEVVLVSSGAIASGMTVMQMEKRPSTIGKKQAVAALGQPLLMQIYSQNFLKRKLHVAQMLLTREDLNHRERFLNAQHAMDELLKMGAVPIVNENDSVAIEEIQFGDNDQLSALVAHLVDADLLMILTDIDGLYDRDPKKFPSANRILRVEDVDDSVMKLAGDTTSTKSTGGMITKLKAARQAALFGLPMWLGCGTDPAIISRVLNGSDEGTVFVPRSR